MSKFRFSRRSLAEMKGVRPELIDVVRLALKKTPVDFMVFDGIRTLSAQKDLVRRRASKTLKSKHLVQPDGYGHAVDLVPIIGGKPRWHWPPIYEIASAMSMAADELGHPIRWGGYWGTLKPGSAAAMKRRVEAYTAKRRAAGRSSFIDGPHYEWRGK